jgi:hypothetical protein
MKIISFRDADANVEVEISGIGTLCNTVVDE